MKLFLHVVDSQYISANPKLTDCNLLKERNEQILCLLRVKIKSKTIESNFFTLVGR